MINAQPSGTVISRGTEERECRNITERGREEKINEGNSLERLGTG